MNTALDPEFARVLREIMLKISSHEIEEFRADQPLSDLGLDSVSLAEVVVMLEDEWNVSLDPTEIAEIQNFGQLQELMQRKRDQA